MFIYINENAVVKWLFWDKQMKRYSILGFEVKKTQKYQILIKHISLTVLSHASNLLQQM